MTTTANLKTKAPEIFEVYFMTKGYSNSLTDILFNKAVVDYHRMYDFRGLVTHVAVRLGTHVYEVTSEGTVKYPWSAELLENYRIIGLYTLDISNISEDKRLAALFNLEQCLGQKLDIPGCLRYLYQSIGFGKTEAAMLHMGMNSTQDQIKLKTGTFVKQGRKNFFCLPYTCATLVNIVLNRLVGFEPSFAGHLAQSSALSLTLFAEVGLGAIFDLDTQEWIVGNCG